MRTILPVLALSLAACSSAEGDVYLLYLSPVENTECQIHVSENFTEANVPEDEEQDSDWTYEIERERSDALVYASIADGRKGAAYLTIGGQVIPGTRKGKTYTFTWTDSDNTEELQEFGPTEYRYSEKEIDEETIELTFERDKETGGLTGHIKNKSVSEVILAETDEWDNAEYPQLPFTGQINAYSAWLLTGSGTTNEPDQSNCDASECTITIQETCNSQAPIRAEWVGYSDAALGLMGFF